MTYSKTCTLNNLVVHSPATHAYWNLDVNNSNGKGYESLIITNSTMTSIPQGLVTAFPELKHIKIIGCSLPRIRRVTFSGMVMLRTLDLKGNNLTWTPRDALWDLYSLETISFANNYIETMHKDTFRELAKLRQIDARRNRIEVLHTDLFHKNVELREINFSWNELKYLEASVFKNNLQLEFIVLSHNHLQDIAVDFTKLKSLKFLDFRENKCDVGSYEIANGTFAYDTLSRDLKICV